MFSAVILFFLLFEWKEIDAILPPMEGQCENNFIDINPLVIMEKWTVVKHTDNLPPPVEDGCMSIIFGRRCSWGSSFRMDVIVQMKDEETGMSVDTLVLRADVANSKKEEPFHVSQVKVPKFFPPNIMITHLTGTEGENQCFAAWTCDEMQNSVQKAAWIVCTKPEELTDDTLKDLTEDLTKKSGIEESYLITTKYKECIFE